VASMYATTRRIEISASFRKDIRMDQHKIKVKSYMLVEATPEFDFMAKFNNNKPMPLRIMVGTVERETRGMVYMKLHADITERINPICMKCGRPITNPVSQYFGMGPECGGHNYVNPFKTDDELKQAVEEYRKKLQAITWEGWVIKSAIESDEILANTADNNGEVSANTPSVGKVVKVSILPSEQVGTTQSVFIESEYDHELISFIRNLSARFWHAERKVWEVSAKYLPNLVDFLKKGQYMYELSGALSAEKPTIPKIDFNFKTKPFNHQLTGFNFGLEHERWLLADEQGLGKTKQVIDIACAYKQIRGYKHCLIVCGVNGLKWNWFNEISTHSNEKGHILGIKRNGTIGTNNDKLRDVDHLDEIEDYFLITNVETLRDNRIADALQARCKSKDIGIVAIDEVHKCKNPSSQQGKGILKVLPEVRIAMTGTPLMNTPLDLYIVLKWLGYESHSFYQFRNHYCVFGGYGGYEVMGYKNMEQLQEQVKDIMLRRLKTEVFDLPEKTFVDEYVEMTPKQSVIYKEVSNAIRENIDQIKMSANPLSEMIRMRQATGYTGILSSTVRESAKLDRMEELVEEAVANGKKVVIFSNWTQITDEALMRLSKRYDGVSITGETPDEIRQKNMEMFQTRDDCKFIIGTIGAMGTGFTLTAGSIEIFLDEPWNRALKDQAVDRCHRIGTTENVTIFTLLCKGTIDEKIHTLVYEKGEMSDTLIDGQIARNKIGIVDFLLS